MKFSWKTIVLILAALLLLGAFTSALKGVDDKEEEDGTTEVTETEPFVLSCTVEYFCRCADDGIHSITIEFDEGQSFAQVFEHCIDQGDYSSFFDSNCETNDGTPSVTSIAGAKIKGSDTTVANDLPLVNGVTYTLYSEAMAYYNDYEFTYVSGMTWAQFVGSEYNTLGFSTLDGFVMKNSSSNLIDAGNENGNVLSSDLIKRLSAYY